MNKRAVIEEWGNIFIAVGISVITLFVFGIFVSSDAVKKEKEIVEKDAQLQRENTLLNYLRTPVSQTDFVASGALSNENIFPLVKADIEKTQNYAIENNLRVADLFTLMASNEAYQRLLEFITRNDKEFSKHRITVLRPEKGILFLTAGKGCAEVSKTSTAYLPYNNTVVNIIMIACKG